MFDDVEVCPSEGKDLMVFNEKMCGAINEKIEKLVRSDLSIVGMTVEPHQIPTQENRYTAVIKAGLHTGVGSFEALGTSTPEIIDGAQDIGKLIDKATANALSKVFTYATVIHQTTYKNQTQFLLDNQNQKNSNSQQYKKSNIQKQSGHSSDKPVSDGQIKFINKLCHRHGISDIEARNMAGIHTIEQLSSKDANAIIQALK